MMQVQCAMLRLLKHVESLLINMQGDGLIRACMVVWRCTSTGYMHQPGVRLLLHVQVI